MADGGARPQDPEPASSAPKRQRANVRASRSCAPRVHSPCGADCARAQRKRVVTRCTSPSHFNVTPEEVSLCSAAGCAAPPVRRSVISLGRRVRACVCAHATGGAVRAGVADRHAEPRARCATPGRCPSRSGGRLMRAPLSPPQLISSHVPSRASSTAGATVCASARWALLADPRARSNLREGGRCHRRGGSQVQQVCFCVRRHTRYRFSSARAHGGACTQH